LSRRLRIVVEYDGTDFAGWQKQIEQRTVQETLEAAIRDMTGESVFVRAAGRTDAGVHADAQVASFDLAANIPAHGLLRGLNTILPADLAIVDAELGINHTYLFCEFHYADISGFGAANKMNLSDKTLNAGLAFEF